MAAYYTVDKVLQNTVGELVTAATAVEKFRNQTGMTAEDSSRLLKVLDDLGISAGDVETAFKFAEKNGFQPSIQSLEDMQAKYQELNPGMERSQFLLSQFGKSGLTLQKFFETGDAAERLQEVNKALLISDDNIKSVQEYKDNLNDLQDAWEALKISGGKVLLPIVVSITKATVDEMEANQAYTDQMAQNTETQRQAFGNRQEGVYGVTHAVNLQAVAQQDLDRILEVSNNKEKDYIITRKEDVQTQTDYKNILDATAPSLNELAASAYEASLMVDGVISADTLRQAADYERSLGLISDAEYDAKIQAAELQAAINAMQDKNITITTTWLNYTIERIGGTNAPRPTTTGGSVSAKASGGMFSEGAARVGEQGEEWLMRNAAGQVVVIPNDMVRKMEAWGISPGAMMAGGGVIGDFGQVPIWRGPTPGISDRPNPNAVIDIGSNGQYYTGADYMTFQNGVQTSAGSGGAPGSRGSAGITPVIQATQSVSAAAVSIAASGEKTAQATQENTAANNAANQALLSELKDINRRLTNMPRDMAAAVAKIVSS